MTVSNIGVQVYEHVFATQFRDTPHSQALIVRRWDLLSPQPFSVRLEMRPKPFAAFIEDWDLRMTRTTFSI